MTKKVENAQSDSGIKFILLLNLIEFDAQLFYFIKEIHLVLYYLNK
jgi:hypothetical protein